MRPLLDAVTSASIAFVTAFIGLVTAAVGIAAQGATEIAPWLGAGGTAAATTALAYMAKMLADGRLVSQNTARILEEQRIGNERLSAIAQDNHSIAKENQAIATRLLDFLEGRSRGDRGQGGRS